LDVANALQYTAINTGRHSYEEYGRVLQNSVVLLENGSKQIMGKTMDNQLIDLVPIATGESFTSQPVKLTLIPISDEIPYGIEIHRKEDKQSIPHECGPIIDPRTKTYIASLLEAKASNKRPEISLKHSKPIDPDILVIEEVAFICRASVYSIRRIPKEDLPVYRGLGRRNIYLREDLKRYIKLRRIQAPISSSFIDEILQ
jgi:hypothetical protein